MTSAHESQPPCPQALLAKARILKLHGLIEHFDELQTSELLWLEKLLLWEEQERNRRGLVRRLRAAHLGAFKSLADFDWDWPTQCDKAAVLELMTLNFLNEANNVILIGPNGIGKSMLAKNIAHQGVIKGHSVLFTNAAQMLGELAAQAVNIELNHELAITDR